MKLPYTQHFPHGGMPITEFNAYLQAYPFLVPAGAMLEVFYSDYGMVDHFTVSPPIEKPNPVQSPPTSARLHS